MADTQKDTVRVYLRRSLSQRGADGRIGQTYGPGEVEVPRALAASLNLAALPSVQGDDPEGAADEVGRRKAGASAPAAPKEGEGEGDDEDTGDRYDGMTKADLVAEANTRGVTVARSDGKDGDPLLLDYQTALRNADAAGEGGSGTGE